jgi:pyruvate dehydrogenase E2 component (dihydrolipoamide acetyltransferase)
MATVIDMPKLSDTMSVGTLISWLKNEGDAIEPGDLIAEVETDKATMELEAFDEGVLLKQVAAVGDQIPIGGIVAVIGEKGEKIDLEALTGGAPKADAPKEAEKSESEDTDSSEPEAKAETPDEKDDTSEEKEVAASTEVLKAPPSDGRVKASPLARKLAEKKGIDLATVKGTGPGGRVVKADVESASGAPAASKASSTSAPVSIPSSRTGTAIAEEGKLPLSGMRTVIAQRLMESKSQVPHFYLETDIDVAPLMKLRADLNAYLSQLPPEQGGIKLTVTDFILKATAEALRRVPQVNSSWGGDHVMQHGAVHMGVAVAVDDGLVVPVIQDAHAKGVRQISADLKELAGKAKNKKLKPNEMSGSTFTVSSLGMFPITGFFGIINQPNAGILSVGTAVKQPVVDAHDQIVVGHRMTVGGSFDHRVVDGAVGAMFLKALKEILETPALILL